MQFGLGILFERWHRSGGPSARSSDAHFFLISPYSFIFMQFGANILQNNILVHLTRELVPLGNPGCTTVNIFIEAKNVLLSGVWLSSFNSTANPFVYALLMPSYRKCVRQTFCACVTGRNRNRRMDSQGSGALQTISCEISVSSHKTRD